MRDVNIIFENRKNNASTSIDKVAGGGSVGYLFWKAKVSASSESKKLNETNIYSKLVLKCEAPTLFGLVCKKMPEFPKISWNDRNKISNICTPYALQKLESSINPVELSKRQDAMLLPKSEWQIIDLNLWEYKPSDDT